MSPRAAALVAGIVSAAWVATRAASFLSLPSDYVAYLPADALDDLRNRILSGYPLLLLRTYEEERWEQALSELSQLSAYRPQVVSGAAERSTPMASRQPPRRSCAALSSASAGT